MIQLDSNLRCSLSLYIFFCIFIYLVKPSFIFDENNNFKDFGLSDDKTIYPFWLITSIFGLFIHYGVLLLNTNYV